MPSESSARAVRPTAASNASAAPPAPRQTPPSTETPPHAFVDDDLEGALEQARREGKAVFVDAWAPWCHTCLSMKHYVLDDPRLRAFGDRVIFVALDTDREENAEFVDRVQVATWPTFYVLDAASGMPVDAWPGAASAEELAAFVGAALDVIEAQAAATTDDDTPAASLARAKRAEVDGHLDEATSHYHQTLASHPTEFGRRSEAALGAIRTLSRGHAWRRCAEVGRDELPRVTGAALPADFASYYLGCVSHLDKRRPHVELVVQRLKALTDAPPAGATPDDRADALRILADAYDALGRHDDARGARERRLAILEEAARSAPTPEIAQTFDDARTSTYLALGRPDDAVALLVARRDQLPDSYAPASRLAGVLRRLGRPVEALAALDLALARSYGLVRPRLLASKAGLLIELGRISEAVGTLTEEVASYEAAPATPMNARRLADARRRLEAALRGPASGAR